MSLDASRGASFANMLADGHSVEVLENLISEHYDGVSILTDDSVHAAAQHLLQFHDSVVIIATGYDAEAGVTYRMRATHGNAYAAKASVLDMADEYVLGEDDGTE